MTPELPPELLAMIEPEDTGAFVAEPGALLAEFAPPAAQPLKLREGTRAPAQTASPTKGGALLRFEPDTRPRPRIGLPPDVPRVVPFEVPPLRPSTLAPIRIPSEQIHAGAHRGVWTITYHAEQLYSGAKLHYWRGLFRGDWHATYFGSSCCDLPTLQRLTLDMLDHADPAHAGDPLTFELEDLVMLWRLHVRRGSFRVWVYADGDPSGRTKALATEWFTQDNPSLQKGGAR